MTTSCLATDVIVAVRRRDDDRSDHLLWELAQSFVVTDWVTTDAQRPPERAPTARGGPELRGPRALSSAHNPKVAGSNPAPAMRESPANGGLFCGRVPSTARSTARFRTNFESQASKSRAHKP